MSCFKPFCCLIGSFFILCLCCFSASGYSALIITDVAAPSVVDFSDFTGNGIFPGGGNGRLDSDTIRIRGLTDNVAVGFGDFIRAGDYARGTSSEGGLPEGVYSFNVGSGGASSTLGIQTRGGDFTPGTITLRVQNLSGQSIDRADLSYDFYAYNNSNRSVFLLTEFSESDNDNNNDRDDGYQPTGLFVQTPSTEDASPTWTHENFSTSVTFSSPLAHTGEFYFRFRNFAPVPTSEFGDAFALDNISVTGLVNFEVSSPVPEPGRLSLLTGVGMTLYACRRRRKCISTDKDQAYPFVES